MLDPDADKFVAEMKDHNVVVPKVGQTRHGVSQRWQPRLQRAPVA